MGGSLYRPLAVVNEFAVARRWSSQCLSFRDALRADNLLKISCDCQIKYPSVYRLYRDRPRFVTIHYSFVASKGYNFAAFPYIALNF
jgi:hypothetical protein